MSSKTKISAQISTLFLLLFISLPSLAQEKHTLSGYINDFDSGESLIGAVVYLKSNPQKGCSSNAFGFYSLTLEEGEHQLMVSYLGYQDKELSIDLSKDQELNIELESTVLTAEEVVVVDKRTDENINDAKMGTIELSVEKIKSIPAFMGEVDILKSIQLLPGVQSVSEGTGGFYVRGGGANQNLMLLDDAIVYNGGHLLGFFSVFNADAIKNTKLIKGGMPAEYGGRISSVLDISMKDGNNKRLQVDGGLGFISSRLTVQGPLIKEKCSFLVSGRRTYLLDLAQPYINTTEYAGTNYYFYDLNAKLNYIISQKDRLFLSGYFGRDVFDYSSAERGFSLQIPWGNATASLRWNHLFNEKMFLNTTLIFNDYNFEFYGQQDEFDFTLFSGIRDYSLKMDLDIYASSRHKLKLGGQYFYHIFTPNRSVGNLGDTELEEILFKRYAHEAAVYLQDEFKISEKLLVELGLRASMFQQVGPYERAAFNGSSVDTLKYEKLEPVKTYSGLEPRLNARYKLDKSSSIKASISSNKQYVHLVSNSASTLPTDVWIPSSDLVKPQQGIQYALGYFKNFDNNRYESSIEVFYRNLKDQIDYSDVYVPELGEELELNFDFGKGRVFGFELFFKKAIGDLNGWIGYTYTNTQNTFQNINNGLPFVTNYDRPHDLAAALNYEINDKWQIGAAFVFASDKPFTPAESIFITTDGRIGTIYGERNTVRIKDYHRLDFTLNWTPKPNKKKGVKSTFNFSAFNVYGRKNYFFYYYDPQVFEGNFDNKMYGVSIFPTIVPSISWNFSY